MDVGILQEWLNQIVNNIPILVISVVFIGGIFVIAFKIISVQNKMIINYIDQSDIRQNQEKENREEFRKEIYAQLDKTLDIYQDVKISLPLIKSFSERYPKIEGVLNFLNQNKHSYYDFLESIFSRAKYSFKTNFKNGSHEEKADTIVNKSYEHILRTIGEEDDLINKEYHMAFANVFRKELLMLTSVLVRIDDIPVKFKMIDAYFNNLRNLLYHFRIYLGDKYLKMKPDQVEIELSESFRNIEINVEEKISPNEEIKG